MRLRALIPGSIDPQTDEGSAYEGFLLETGDADGVPVPDPHG